MNRAEKALRGVRELGPLPVARDAVYRGLLKSGIYRSAMPYYPCRLEKDHGEFHPLPIPARDEIRPYLSADSEKVFTEAGEIRMGTYHPFSGKKSAELDLNPINGSRHWAAKVKIPVPDLKLIWEPARFCWVDPLMRSEALSRSGLSENIFWDRLTEFNRKNPVNLGENWESAQEVGLRLINIAFAASLFLQLPQGDKIYLTSAKHAEVQDERREMTAKTISAHARRIMGTLIYARSQRNNHLLSEAAALMTAAAVLPDAKDAKKWQRTGRREFMRAVNDQFAANGCYIQQSANYHRLALQLIIWVDRLLRLQGDAWPKKLLPKLAASVTWLNAWVDPASGNCSNVGHNDGSLLFDFGCGYADYRPTLQAGAMLFLGEKLFPAGKWDELSVWMDARERETVEVRENLGPLSLTNGNSRALMLAENFRGRPAHADRLHTEVWMNGVNELIDAGTYRYSGEESWENRLKSAFCHNVLTVDDAEPMEDAGKFLWLKRDRCKILCREDDQISAEHSAYSDLYLSHCRAIVPEGDGFRVSDDVLSMSSKGCVEHTWRLQWLLPDQSFLYDKNGGLELERVTLSFKSNYPLILRVVRGGRCVFSTGKGSGNLNAAADAVCGWYSPTYDEKEPALSVIVTAHGAAPFRIETVILPKQ